jgi:thiol-disulfide isomerase/thioredoxin
MVAAAAAASGCGGGGEDDRSWPSVEVETLDAGGGTTVSSSSMIADRPTVVTVWAVSCQPCREELPALQALLDDSGTSLAVVGVNNGDRPADATAFLDEIGVSFPMYRDPQARLTSALAVASLPATMLVLPDGTVVWKHLGAVSIDEVRRRVEPHLSLRDQPIEG